jgi:hypothetical protein
MNIHSFPYMPYGWTTKKVPMRQVSTQVNALSRAVFSVHWEEIDSVMNLER